MVNGRNWWVGTGCTCLFVPAPGHYIKCRVWRTLVAVVTDGSIERGRHLRPTSCLNADTSQPWRRANGHSVATSVSTKSNTSNKIYKSVLKHHYQDFKNVSSCVQLSISDTQVPVAFLKKHFVPELEQKTPGENVRSAPIRVLTIFLGHTRSGILMGTFRVTIQTSYTLFAFDIRPLPTKKKSGIGLFIFLILFFS